MWDGSDNELRTESENDIGKDSDREDYSAFVLTLKEDLVLITGEIDVNEKEVPTCQRNTQLISSGCFRAV